MPETNIDENILGFLLVRNQKVKNLISVSHLAKRLLISWFLHKIERLYFIIKILMSKPHVSPYRRNAYNNSRNGVSPYRDEPLKLAEVLNLQFQKSKLSHSLIADHNMDKRTVPSKEEGTRATEKKRGY